MFVCLYVCVHRYSKATRIAGSSDPSEMKYQVLLIITDGEITDMADTMEAIISASAKPLSIIVIGVGSHDFQKMNELDGDGGLLRNGSHTAQRDVVQFVPFRQAKSPEDLAAKVLAEIPGQLLEYMKKNGLQPRNVGA